MADAPAPQPELARIAEQVRRSFEGEAWHGPAVLEALDGVTAAMASARPIAGAHTIWELVLHLTATYDLVLRRLSGDATRLTPEDDWPPMGDPTEERWAEAVAALRAADSRAREAIARHPADRLDEPIVAGVPYPAHMQFAGLAEHNVYHAGQMMLLRRALRA